MEQKEAKQNTDLAEWLEGSGRESKLFSKCKPGSHDEIMAKGISRNIRTPERKCRGKNRNGVEIRSKAPEHGVRSG